MSYWEFHSGRPHSRDDRYMSTLRKYSGRKMPRSRFSYAGGPARSRRRRNVVRIVPRQRGLVRVGGFYGRYSNGGETKFHDIDIDGTFTTAGAIQNGGTVNIIPQGVLENNRVGRKCTIKTVHWRYNIQIPTTASSSETSDSARVILYVDKQCNGATATVANILAAANYQAYRALENVGRFKILLDKTHKIQCGGGVGGAIDLWAENQQNYRFSKKCNIPIEYDNSASTGVLTTIRTNNIGVLLIGQGGFATMDSKMRLRFSDS